MAIFGIFGFHAKSGISVDFLEKAKIAIFWASNRSKTSQKGFKPPSNTPRTSLAMLCLESENRKIFPIFRVLAQDFRPEKTGNPKSRNLDNSAFQPFGTQSS